MDAARPNVRRLFVYNGGFLTQSRVRRILTLSGWDVKLGKPGEADWIGVWGQSPTSPRGEAVAERTGAPILRVEDPFLRSVLPGRDGEPPLGLLLDQSGVHFDPSAPSDLEKLLSEHPLDDTALLSRARLALSRMQRLKLSKYNAFEDIAPPEPGYVLVIDQTKGDASVTASRADRNRFLEMIMDARDAHPGARILLRTHPETRAGHRDGHFTAEDASGDVELYDAPISPMALLEGAIAVYTVSSQFGFEAILAGHKPRVYGQPFYMGWGLTEDEVPLTRRQRRLTRAQLFTAAMILYPKWYDPFRDTLCELEEVMDTLEARARAWREDHNGWTASGMSLWKRGPLSRFFGKVRFAKDLSSADGPKMVWASKDPVDGAIRVEDGFLRSRGLGADLVPPLSLVTDDLGIYYDPSKPSRLEHLIETGSALEDDDRQRAKDLISRLTDLEVTKYNLFGHLPELPKGRRILVPGQVEDDASILKGAGEVRTNAALLQAARAANPAAVVIYKPHPDVEAGLREGAINAGAWADVVAEKADAAALMAKVDEVWTMTSLLGFEALIRGKAVTCYGTPFYAGWGLTDDRGALCPRRSARPDLETLVHRALIDYPRYFDPKTGTPCPVEVAVERLAHGDMPKPGPMNRSLAKLQGLFASYSWLWRR